MANGSPKIVPAQPEHIQAGHIEWLRVGDIKVDDSYQRPLRPKHVSSIAHDFQEDRLGIPVISRRKDGDYAVDGQHRIEALVLRGKQDAMIQCLIHMEYSVAQEARAFVDGQEGRINLTPYDRFKAKLRAKDPGALEIKGVLDKVGLAAVGGMTERSNLVTGAETDHHSQAGTIMAIGTVTEIYDRRGADFLATVLEVITNAWGEYRLTATPIKGVGTVLAAYGDKVDLSALEKSMRKTDPFTVEREAHTIKKGQPWSIGNYFAFILITNYNRYKQGKGRLDMTTIASLALAYRRKNGQHHEAGDA